MVACEARAQVPRPISRGESSDAPHSQILDEDVGCFKDKRGDISEAGSGIDQRD